MVTNLTKPGVPWPKIVIWAWLLFWARQVRRRGFGAISVTPDRNHFGDKAQLNRWKASTLRAAGKDGGEDGRLRASE